MAVSSTDNKPDLAAATIYGLGLGATGVALAALGAVGKSFWGFRGFVAYPLIFAGGIAGVKAVEYFSSSFLDWYNSTASTIFADLKKKVKNTYKAAPIGIAVTWIADRSLNMSFPAACAAAAATSAAIGYFFPGKEEKPADQNSKDQLVKNLGQLGEGEFDVLLPERIDFINDQTPFLMGGRRWGSVAAAFKAAKGEAIKTNNWDCNVKVDTKGKLRRRSDGIPYPAYSMRNILEAKFRQDETAREHLIGTLNDDGDWVGGLTDKELEENYSKSKTVKNLPQILQAVRDWLREHPEELTESPPGFRMTSFRDPF